MFYLCGGQTGGEGAAGDDDTTRSLGERSHDTTASVTRRESQAPGGWPPQVLPATPSSVTQTDVGSQKLADTTEPLNLFSSWEPLGQNSRWEPFCQYLSWEPLGQNSSREPHRQYSSREPVSLYLSREPISQNSSWEPLSQ